LKVRLQVSGYKLQGGGYEADVTLAGILKGPENLKPVPVARCLSRTLVADG
jgi:hypothetical protein